MKNLLDTAGLGPDDSIQALKYVASVGAVDKEIVDKAKAVARA